MLQAISRPLPSGTETRFRRHQSAKVAVSCSMGQVVACTLRSSLLLLWKTALRVLADQAVEKYYAPQHLLYTAGARARNQPCQHYGLARPAMFRFRSDEGSTVPPPIAAARSRVSRHPVRDPLRQGAVRFSLRSIYGNMNAGACVLEKKPWRVRSCVSR